MNDQDKTTLEFERKWWHYAGHKEAEIPTRFGVSVVRYYQILSRLLDDPEALAFDPTLVRRLPRIQTSRARARNSEKERNARHSDV